jgi:propanol-preferring alcohol dehydrogenase
MKAMVLDKPMPIEKKPLKLRDVEVREPGDDEILLEIKCCGVCRTDLHIVEGDLPPVKLPVIPGHQVVAVVKEVGRSVDDVSIGDRVGVPWLYWACGKCKYCRRGLENLCEHALFTGYSVDGGYAEYMIAKKGFVHPLPKTHDDCHAAPLLCAGAVGYRTLRLTGLVDRGEGVLGIFGFGASGHLILQAAKALGLEVYVFTHTPWKIDYAYKLGADWAGNTRDEPPKKLDAAIVYAPVSWVFKEALRKLDRGGRLVLGEIYMEPIRELDYSLLWYEREIKTTANVTRRDVREFLKLAEEHHILTTL